MPPQAYISRLTIITVCVLLLNFSPKLQAQNCSFTLGDDITVCTSSPPISTTLGISGSIVGGTPPFTYLWHYGNTWFTTPTITVNPPITTTYTLTIHDAIGCFSTDQITIFVSDPVPATIDGPRDLCGGHDAVYQLGNTAGMDVTISIPANYGSIVGGIINGTNCELTGNNITLFTVHWGSFTSLPNFVTMSVTITDIYGCTKTSLLNVFPCCEILHQPEGFDMQIHASKTFGPGQLFEFHGTMDVYADVTFDAATIYMGAMARIVVHPNGNLLITNGSHFTRVPECNYMWDGIYTEDNNPHIKSVVIDNGSIIEDAINAIVSTHNGNFQVDNAQFLNNYIGIKISDYCNGLPGYIPNTPYDCILKGTTFESNTTNFTLLHAPFIGVRPFAGIVVRNVNNVEIGTMNTGLNTFMHTQYGIYSTNSFLNVYNNSFSYIGPIAYSKGTEAIHAYYIPDPAHPINFTPRLVAGDLNSTYLNEFSHCFYGIKNYNQAADIINNAFTECSNAIFCLQTVPKTNIIRNKIGALAQIPLVGKGITVVGTAPLSKGIDLVIFHNNVTDIKDGIYLINQAGCSIIHPDISENQIYWSNTQTTTLTRTGINLQSCGYSEVHDNTIQQYNYSPLSSDVLLLRGIRIAQSENALVERNTIIKVGSGIYTNGSLINTLFECNTLDNCYHGFYFHVNTALSEQGGNTIQPCWVTNNRFIGLYDIPPYQYVRKMAQFYDPITNAASIMNPPINWLYNITTDPEYQLDVNLNTSTPVNHPCYQYVIGVPLTGCDVLCENLPKSVLLDSIKDTITREDRFGKIIRNEISYDTLVGQYNWYEKKYLLHLITNDSNLINLGGYDDYRYQEIFDSLKGGSTGTVERINEYLTGGNYQEASKENDNLPENEIWVKNIKEANEVYLNTWANGIFELDASDSTVLWPIALSTPYEGGPGVYTARVMLGIDPEDYFVPYSAPINSDNSGLMDFEMWPNPASNSLFITTVSIPSQLSVIEFHNVNGSLVYTFPLNSNSTEINISLNTIKSGIYFCRIKNANNITKTKKLVIIK